MKERIGDYIWKYGVKQTVIWPDGSEEVKEPKMTELFSDREEAYREMYYRIHRLVDKLKWSEKAHKLFDETEHAIHILEVGGIGFRFEVVAVTTDIKRNEDIKLFD